MSQQLNSASEESMKATKTSRWRSTNWPIVSALAVYIPLVTLWHKHMGESLHWALKLVIYFALYLVFAVLFARLGRSEKAKQEPHPALNWPVSGPIRYLGRYAMLLVFLPTMLLSNLNPFLLIQQLRQIFGQIVAARRTKRNLLDVESYQNKVEYRLPFNGEWLVYNGGLTQETSHSWNVLAQRFAYDFVKADNRFARHCKSGARLNHYFCYGEPILAAADGEVISVENRIGDAPLVGFGVADFLCRHFAGNHVVIKHADGEYGFYAHLIKGSVSVKPGEKVKQGQSIGRCGHSGFSSEPHLHFHLQDSPSLFTSMGVPFRFVSLKRNGEFIESEGEITRGQRVESV